MGNANRAGFPGQRELTAGEAFRELQRAAKIQSQSRADLVADYVKPGLVELISRLVELGLATVNGLGSKLNTKFTSINSSLQQSPEFDAWLCPPCRLPSGALHSAF